MVDAENVIKQACHVIANNVQTELGCFDTIDTPPSATGSTGKKTTESTGKKATESTAKTAQDEPSPSQDTVYDMNKVVQDLATDIDIHDRAHPFYGVFQAHNQSFVQPAEPTLHSQLQKRLFRFIVEQLPAFSNLPKLKQKDVYVAASSIAYLHMEDAAHVLGKDLPELTNRTKDSKFANPPQFLTDILVMLKEGASKENGDLDVHRLCLLVDNEIGGMAMKELYGTQ
ncbi:hypothetical protein BGZ95_001394, partial [Linnemannia exigua]